MKYKKANRLVIALFVNFLLIVSFFVMQAWVDDDRIPFWILAVIGLSFLVLGSWLFFVAKKAEGKLKKVLKITALSAIAPLPLTILHNVFYAFAILIPFLDWFFEFLHGAAFVVALLVAPVVFLVTSIISLVMLNKKNRSDRNDSN